MPEIDNLRRQGKLILHFLVEGQVLDADSNSTQIMAYHFYIMLAESYTNNISDNVKRSFNQMREEGKLTGSAPIGYLNRRDENGNADIILDKTRAPFIRKIFEEYSTGLYSLKQLRDKTITWGLKNKTKSNTYLSVSQIDKILKSKFYHGYITYKTKTYEHIYPRIIDKELYKKCEDVRNGKSKNYSNDTKKDFIFKGLIICKDCGCTITPEIKKGKYIYLRQNPKNGCTCKQINENEALETVENVLSSMPLKEELANALKSELKENLKKEESFKINSLTMLTKELEAINKKSKKLLNLYLENDESITKEEYNNQKQEFLKEKDKIESQIAKLNATNDDFEISAEYLIDLTSRVDSLFKSSGIEKKRKILKLLFPNLYLDSGNISYTIRKPFHLFVKRAYRSKTLGRKDSNL